MPGPAYLVGESSRAEGLQAAGGRLLWYGGEHACQLCHPLPVLRIRSIAHILCVKLLACGCKLLDTRSAPQLPASADSSSRQDRAELSGPLNSKHLHLRARTPRQSEALREDGGCCVGTCCCYMRCSAGSVRQAWHRTHLRQVPARALSQHTSSSCNSSGPCSRLQPLYVSMCMLWRLRRTLPWPSAGCPQERQQTPLQQAGLHPGRHQGCLHQWLQATA